MHHAITITLDIDSLDNVTDSYLAALWHVAQANPAAYGDIASGELADSIGDEIIRRFLASARPELYNHRKRHHYHKALAEHCKCVDGQWVLKQPQSDSQVTPPRIGANWPEQGGVYAGIVRGEEGAADHHLILLPGDAQDLTWQAAMDWANDAGGALPTRCEQALLYANVKGLFEAEWYWSCEQHASVPVCAWLQDFVLGDQNYYDKASKDRARAVRRFEILAAV